MSPIVPTSNEEYRKSIKLGDVMQARALQIEERLADPELYRPIPTHIPALNEIIHGFPVDDPFYMLLFSSEKIGKTTFGMDFADAWRKGTKEPVLYVQLEELSRQYADRTFASMTSLTKDDIRTLNITPEQMQEIYDAANEVSMGDDNLLIQDDLFSLYTVDEEMKRLGCTKAVFDNLQLFDQDGFTGSNSQERFAAISKHIVKSRNQKGNSYVVISQMGEKGRAFGSGQANRDADILIEIEYVYQNEDSEEPIDGLRGLIVHPSRISRPGKCQVVFDGAKNKISPFIRVDINSQSFLEILAKEGPEAKVFI